MAENENTHRLLYPKPRRLTQARKVADAVEQPDLSASTIQSTPALRRPKAPVRTDVEWKANQEIIRKLYLVDDLPLGMVINVMGADHGFWAS